VIESMVRTRKEKGKYSSFSDFLDKSELIACNKRAIESLIKAGAFDSLGHARKALCEVHENAVDSIVPVKKQQAIGQDDLFGAMDTGGDGPAIGLDFLISDVEWPRKQKLSLEREMLGLYVSAHPLDGAEHILSRNRDSSIAELIGSGRTQGDVKLAGLITGVERRITKQGNAWAIVHLADRDASLEVCFFPASYQLVSTQLIEDNVVCVRGRINARDSGINIAGQELSILDMASAEHGGRPPVLLVVAAHRVNPQMIAELRRTLMAHPGETPVRMRVESGRRTTLYELGFLINADTIPSDIKTFLGPNAWAGVA
jgi:DNA polymerase-3 subunit alpha